MKIFNNRFALVVLATFFLGISMVSCSPSDDSPDGSIEGSIIGRWALDKRSYTSNGVNTPELDYENNQPGCDLNDYFEFKEGGVFETAYYNPSCDVTPRAGNWTRSGDMIPVTYPEDDDENMILELLSLSASEMKIRIDVTGTDAVEPGMELFINYTLVKVN